MPTTIRIEKQGPRADVVLARPDVRNAFNEVVIRELREAFAALGKDDGVRVIVLRGEGKVFCAGADLEWMKRMSTASREENFKDAEAMAALFREIASCPKYVIAKVHGAALGGGAGLTAAADAAVAEKGTIFGFTEAKIGIVPAVISEVVLRRIGQGRARTLFPTGERFDEETALRIGLVTDVPVDELAVDAAINRMVGEVLTAGPNAVAAAKRLLAEREAWSGLPPEERDRRAAGFISDLRATPEAKEGMAAFLGKRKPGWCPP